ncbi:putative reverse transcriptase domain-containing protein [Tanacetum coccineum]|uniref:Reverse transcriptase domain-containing protein n=1 Tax=Tanacetum coccineum TaxID=301880 RepID=A0ABQ5AFH5_9ASTR
MDQLMNRRDNRRWESGIRVNIPNFAGDTLSPEGFIDWLVVVEEVFDFKEVPENKRVSLIAIPNFVLIQCTLSECISACLQLAFEKQNRQVGSSSSLAITGASGSGNMASRFAPSQAKAGGGNTGLVSRASGSSRLKYFNYGEPGYRQSECKKADKRHLFADLEGDDDAELKCGKKPQFTVDGNSSVRDELCVWRCGEAVQKLGLKTENHPKPYKLQWLKKGGEVTVSKSVHVLFSVGNTYKDNVWCDVVPMDACHLLLDEDEIGDRGFVLIGNEVAEDSEIPEAMIPLFEEFSDVFPDEPHYRMSTREHEDLRRLVEELVSKGHVRESMSPFPIPRLDDLLDQISGATIFTKLDLKIIQRRCFVDELKVLVFGMFVSGDCIQVDESKVAAVQEWPTPTTITEVQSFHGLASFYRRFIPNFSSIMAPLTYCMKGKSFVWTVFELHYLMPQGCIGGVLSQDGGSGLLVTKQVDVPGLDVIRDMVTVDPYFLVVLRGVQAGEKPDFFLHDGFLFKGNQLCIPDSSLACKFIKGITCKGMLAVIVSKGTATNAGLYMPLFVPLQPWVDISMDFVLGLPHAVNVAQLFFRDVYCLHGLPSSIVSDQDTRFLSHFWRSLWKMVNTQLNFSSAYHPQTDGQTEVVNRSLGNLLRCLVGDHVKAWDQKLCQAEFAHNHAVNRSTGFSPFQVVYSAQPRGPLDLMTPRVSSSVPKKVQDFVAGLHGVHKVFHENLVCANSKYKQDADHKRRHVDFEEGDFVWAVLTKDRFPVGEYNKLSAKKIGPLEIVEKINSNAYRMKLPSHIRCSDVFNVKHLIPYHGDSSDDDLTMNLHRGNDGGPSIEE